MRTKLFIFTGLVTSFIASSGLRADVLEMQNGDRYSGKVLSVSADIVVLNSEILGKINVPRNKVASVKFGANVVGLQLSAHPAQPVATNLVAAPATTTLANTNVDLSAALRQLGGNTNFIGQIRQQMLAGSPEAGAKFDEMVNGLMSGQINVSDLRRQAQSSAEQLRELKRELGPDADESLDAYLKILDAFVNETAAEPAGKTSP